MSYDCPLGQVMSYDTLPVVMSYDCPLGQVMSYDYPLGQVMSYDTLRVVISYDWLCQVVGWREKREPYNSKLKLT